MKSVMALDRRVRRTASPAARRALALAACAALFAVPARAQTGAGTAPGGAGIYTCVDDQGRRHTSDRPIPDCNAREQRVLNRDGSLRTVKPPPMTADERAEKEAADRKAAVARAAQADAVRRDRNLMLRYPDEPAHQKAREEALNTVRAAIKATEKRQAELAVERKPLEDEAEFYKGKPLPMKLKLQIDANDAAVDAQKSLAQNQSAELVRVNKLYDAELDRLRRLWAGAAPGSLGPAVTPAALRPASSATTR